MTPTRVRAANRQRARDVADARALDEQWESWPACPRCGDLHPPTTLRCPECRALILPALPVRDTVAT